LSLCRLHAALTLIAALFVLPAAALAEEGVIRLEPGQIPDYDALRFDRGRQIQLGPAFLPTLPSFANDVLTSGVVFPEVPADSPYARLDLSDCVRLALEGNFTLRNSRRSVEIARSSTRSAEAPFIPFVDLVGGSRLSRANNNNASAAGAPYRTNTTLRNNVGVESGVNLPTGGRLSLDSTASRTDTNRRGDFPTDSDTTYGTNAEVRFLQPLLRGGGMDVGTADLRRARLSEMNRILADKLTERDVVLSVINGYFRLLQSARELRVSADAIAERQRFLEETKIKYEVGRVDESEILRAETSYLGELETAINRRRQLDEQREQLLLLLGLPLETPISFIDITDYLAERGRVDIPSDFDVINEAREQRIELMQQDLSVALAEIDYQIQRNAVLPDLSIDGGYGRSDAADQIDSAFGYTDSAWDVGLALRVPLVNIQRREAARRARLTLDSELTNREQRERNITQEALNSRRNVLAAEAQLAVLIRNVERSRKSLELINGRFEVGFASITEVRLAQDDLFQSQTRYSNTLLNYQIALARLYVALGRPLL
jgi:outer membrane protein TolC